jgi:small-conductance mechanosensitive channel
MDEITSLLTTTPAPWPVAAGAAIVVVVALEAIYRLLFGVMQRAVASTTNTLDDVLVRRMRIPAQLLVFLAGAHVFTALRGIEHEVTSKIITVTELLLLAYLAIEAFETIVIDYWVVMRKGARFPSVLRGLGLIVLYSVAVVIIVASVTGINLVPLLATSTVITAVLGLAMQDTLGNLFAGIAISLDKPFVVGDWLMVDGMEGRVHSVGWRAVYLETLSRDMVAIPTALVAKVRVQNFSRPTPVTCRNIELLCATDADPIVVEKVVREAAQTIEAIHAAPDLRVWLVAQTPLAQRWIVKVWIDDFGVHDQIESDVMIAMTVALQKHHLSVRPATHAAA